jgi:hypothetical protein
MFNSNPRGNKLQESDFDRSFRRTGMFMKLAFVLIATLVLVTMTTGAYMGITCYTSGDPNHMACFMISDRVEVGVRAR